MMKDKMILTVRLAMLAVTVFYPVCYYGCTSRAVKVEQAVEVKKTVAVDESTRVTPVPDKMFFRGGMMTAAEKQAILDRDAAEEKQKQAEIAKYLSDGKEHLQADRWDSAIAAFNRLLALDAGHSEALTLLAQAEQGKKENFGKPFTNDLGMKFVWIHPGTFMMGSPTGESGRYDDEKQHQVTLTKGFYMQTAEVTQGQWKAIMGSSPSYFKECGDNCPVEQVSWTDVQEFIRRLNRKTGHTYRLPTEAEWEYACRAGTTGPFNTGDCLPTAQVNYDSKYPFSDCPLGSSREKPVPVKSFAPNAWGLYDMHGNVWEWCSDWFGDYPSGSVIDPVGPSAGYSRIDRGGGWSLEARYCRSASRSDDSPLSRFNNLGFRLVTQ